MPRYVSPNVVKQSQLSGGSSAPCRPPAAATLASPRCVFPAVMEPLTPGSTSPRPRSPTVLSHVGLRTSGGGSAGSPRSVLHGRAQTTAPHDSSPTRPHATVRVDAADVRRVSPASHSSPVTRIEPAARVRSVPETQATGIAAAQPVGRTRSDQSSDARSTSEYEAAKEKLSARRQGEGSPPRALGAGAGAVAGARSDYEIVKEQLSPRVKRSSGDAAAAPATRIVSAGSAASAPAPGADPVVVKPGFAVHPIDMDEGQAGAVRKSVTVSYGVTIRSPRAGGRVSPTPFAGGARVSPGAHGHGHSLDLSPRSRLSQSHSLELNPEPGASPDRLTQSLDLSSHASPKTTFLRPHSSPECGSSSDAASRLSPRPSPRPSPRTSPSVPSQPLSPAARAATPEPKPVARPHPTVGAGSPTARRVVPAAGSPTIPGPGSPRGRSNIEGPRSCTPEPGSPPRRSLVKTKAVTNATHHRAGHVQTTLVPRLKPKPKPKARAVLAKPPPKSAAGPEEPSAATVAAQLDISVPPGRGAESAAPVEALGSLLDMPPIDPDEFAPAVEAAAAAPAPPPEPEPEPVVGGCWTCSECFFENDGPGDCSCCGAAQAEADTANCWQCQHCDMMNSQETAKCKGCDEWMPKYVCPV